MRPRCQRRRPLPLRASAACGCRSADSCGRPACRLPCARHCRHPHQRAAAPGRRANPAGPEPIRRRAAAGLGLSHPGPHGALACLPCTAHCTRVHGLQPRGSTLAVPACNTLPPALAFPLPLPPQDLAFNALTGLMPPARGGVALLPSLELLEIQVRCRGSGQGRAHGSVPLHGAARAWCRGMAGQHRGHAVWMRGLSQTLTPPLPLPRHPERRATTSLAPS